MRIHCVSSRSKDSLSVVVFCYMLMCACCFGLLVSTCQVIGWKDPSEDTLKIIGKEFQTNCYKTIFRKINTEDIFFQLTLITNKDYFSRKKALYCRGICDLYLWS